MSLLLKALENAAKNRENAGSQPDPNPASETKDAAGEITLEPLPQSTRAQSTGHARAQSRGPAQSAPLEDEVSPIHQAQAQSVLRAGAPVSRPGVFEWFARRPLVTFSTAAGLFAIGYGAYLYLQLTNPSLFASRPPPVAKPPVVATNPPSAQPPAPPSPGVAPAPAPPAPTGVLPSPAFTPGPGAAPTAPSTSAQGSAPAVAPPSVGVPAAAAPQVPAPPVAAPPAQRAPATGSPPSAGESAAAARAPAPAPAVPAGPKIAVAPTQPETSAPVRPRAPKPAPARSASATPPEDGIVTGAASQVVPVNATVSSAHQALEKGQLDDAERLYRQSLATDPRSVDAMLGLAAVLDSQNKADAASQYYLRVLEQDPRNAHAQAGLLNLSGRADPVAAEARLKQLIAREPSAFLYFSLGNLYAEHGQWAPAQAAYFQAHTRAPDNPDYAFNLAVGLEHLSQPRIALDYYRRAIALAQSRGHAQFNAAGVQSRIRSLETALAQKP